MLSCSILFFKIHPMLLLAVGVYFYFLLFEKIAFLYSMFSEYLSSLLFGVLINDASMSVPGY